MARRADAHGHASRRDTPRRSRFAGPRRTPSAGQARTRRTPTGPLPRSCTRGRVADPRVDRAWSVHTPARRCGPAHCRHMRGVHFPTFEKWRSNRWCRPGRRCVRSERAHVPCRGILPQGFQLARAVADGPTPWSESVVSEPRDEPQALVPGSHRRARRAGDSHASSRHRRGQSLVEEM